MGQSSRIPSGAQWQDIPANWEDCDLTKIGRVQHWMGTGVPAASSPHSLLTKLSGQRSRTPMAHAGQQGSLPSKLTQLDSASYFTCNNNSTHYIQCTRMVVPQSFSKHKNVHRQTVSPPRNFPLT